MSHMRFAMLPVSTVASYIPRHFWYFNDSIS